MRFFAFLRLIPLILDSLLQLLKVDLKEVTLEKSSLGIDSKLKQLANISLTLVVLEVSIKGMVFISLHY